jgi:hypothetical protein
MNAMPIGSTDMIFLEDDTILLNRLVRPRRILLYGQHALLRGSYRERTELRILRHDFPSDVIV